MIKETGNRFTINWLKTWVWRGLGAVFSPAQLSPAFSQNYLRSPFNIVKQTMKIIFLPQNYNNNSIRVTDWQWPPNPSWHSPWRWGQRGGCPPCTQLYPRSDPFCKILADGKKKIYVLMNVTWGLFPAQPLHSGLHCISDDNKNFKYHILSKLSDDRWNSGIADSWKISSRKIRQV